MESNFKILDNIMKPYFDKKADIERKSTKLGNEEIEITVEKIKELEEELENIRLRHKTAISDFKKMMEQEIEEYINTTFPADSELSSLYASFIRSDLQKNYTENDKFRMNYDQRLKELDDNFKDQEEALLKEIASLKSLIEQSSKSYDDGEKQIRRFVEIKNEVRKNLFEEKEKLNQRVEKLKTEEATYNMAVEDLKQYQIKLNEIVEKLSNFKYEYNVQNQVVNSADWKILYEERVLISDKITDLTNLLVEKTSIIHELNNHNKLIEKVDEYINLTQLTKEEETILENIENNKIVNEDLIEVDDNVKYSKIVEDDKVIVENFENLLGAVFDEVIGIVSNMKTVKINESKGKLNKNEYYLSTKTEDRQYEEIGTVKMDESINLPCGEYISGEDIVEAAEKLYSKPKATTYIVKESGKSYKISKEAVQRLRENLKSCTTISLIRDNKVSKLDLLKVFGKKKTNDVMEQVKIGELNDRNLEEGEYINKNETIDAFKDLFDEKKLQWLRDLIYKFIEKDEEKKFSTGLDDELIIKRK